MGSEGALAVESAVESEEVLAVESEEVLVAESEGVLEEVLVAELVVELQMEMES